MWLPNENGISISQLHMRPAVLSIFGWDHQLNSRFVVFHSLCMLWFVRHLVYKTVLTEFIHASLLLTLRAVKHTGDPNRPESTEVRRTQLVTMVGKPGLNWHRWGTVERTGQVGTSGCGMSQDYPGGVPSADKAALDSFPSMPGCDREDQVLFLWLLESRPC